MEPLQCAVQSMASSSGAFTADNVADLFCWDSGNPVRDWMEQLWRQRTGSDAEFNCVYVILRDEDINALERANIAFSEHYRKENEQFAKVARQALKRDGNHVHYFLWA